MAIRQALSSFAKPLSNVGPVEMRPRSRQWKRSSLRPLGVRNLFNFVRPSRILTIVILLVGIWVMPGLIDSSKQRVSHRAPVHTDRSAVKTHVVRVFTAPKTIVYRDRNGTLYRILADETQVDRFANDTLIYLESERGKIKAETRRKIDELLERAFLDGQDSIARFADWYFGWGRSWLFLKEAAVGGLKGLGVNNVQGFSEAARNEVEAYLIRNYQRFVLKSELRNPIIEAGISQILAQVHARYLETLTTIDSRSTFSEPIHATSRSYGPSRQRRPRDRLGRPEMEGAPLFGG